MAKRIKGIATPSAIASVWLPLFDEVDVEVFDTFVESGDPLVVVIEDPESWDWLALVGFAMDVDATLELDAVSSTSKLQNIHNPISACVLPQTTKTLNILTSGDPVRRKDLR